MATAAATSGMTVLTTVPFLIKQFTYTGGTTTSAAITHGESVAPSFQFGQSSTNTASGGAVVFDSVGATTLKIATTADAEGAGVVTLIWLNQATGGLNPPA